MKNAFGITDKALRNKTCRGETNCQPCVRRMPKEANSIRFCVREEITTHEMNHSSGGIVVQLSPRVRVSPRKKSTFKTY
jgi:hypothetical protein